jgi:hypothetical protein
VRGKSVPPHHPATARPSRFANIHAGAAHSHAFQPMFMRVQERTSAVRTEGGRRAGGWGGGADLTGAGAGLAGSGVRVQSGTELGGRTEKSVSVTENFKIVCVSEPCSAATAGL